MSEGFFLAEVINDASGMPIDYRYLDANPAFGTLVGQASASLVGKTVHEALPALEESWLSHFRQVVLTGKPEHIEHHAMALGREYTAVAYCPRPGQLACLFLDVTEARRARDAIARSERALTEQIERAPFGIYVVGPSLRVVQMNARARGGAFRAVRPVIGCDLAKAVGRAWPEAVVADIVSHFKHTLETGETYSAPQADHPGDDSTCAETCAWTLQRITLPDGHPGVACYYFDAISSHDSEARFRTIAESLPQLVFEVRVDRGPAYFNRRWLEYTGREPDDPADRTELVHPEDRELVRKAWQEAQRQAALFECKYRFRRADGAYRWFLARAFPLKNAAGQVVRWFGTATDVHGLTEAQQTSREDEALLRAVVDTIAEPIYVKDAQSRLLLANAATVALLGKPKERIIGHSDRELYDDPTIGEAILEHDRHVMASGQVEVFEERVTTPVGERILLNTKAPRRDASGRVVGVVGVARDITALKRSDEEKARILREIDEQRGRLQAVVDSLPVGLGLADASGRLLLVNDHARALWGDAPSDGLSARGAYRAWDVHSGAPVDAHDLPLARALRGEICRDVVLGFERFDGTRGTQLVSASPVRSPDGSINGAVTVFQDITERTRMETALLDADRRKNEFLAVLSHELRNPLAPIVNSLYILERAPSGGEQATRARQVIERQVAHLSNLVNDLLDITRIARSKIQLQRQRLELNEMVRRAVDDNRSLFDRSGVRLQVDLAPHPVVVHADRTRIAQVVGNLLHNAAKFTLEGGCTHVSVAVDEGRAVVRVADDGVGMASETLTGLFKAFMQAEQTLDRSTGGLGLGLALVKGLVELHGGTVTAHSDGLGQGSEFVVRLPIEQEVGVDGSALGPGARKPRRRILIIEDNLDAADSLREALELGEHEVVCAHDGTVGLAKARTLRPDIVLCDLGLPGIDGFDVARAIRADERLKGTLLVALSGYAFPEDLRRSAEAGFQHHLAKPPNLEKLERLLTDPRGMEP